MMKNRDLKPSADIVQRGTGFYTIEETFSSNSAASRTTCIFLTPGDREDFIALVEFKERLAPKGFVVELVHAGEERRSLESGRWEIHNEECYFYGNSLLEAVRRVRAHVEGDPELLPIPIDKAAR